MLKLNRRIALTPSVLIQHLQVNVESALRWRNASIIRLKDLNCSYLYEPYIVFYYAQIQQKYWSLESNQKRNMAIKSKLLHLRTVDFESKSPFLIQYTCV